MGTWKVDPTYAVGVESASTPDTPSSIKELAMIKRMFDLVSLEIRDDKSFSYNPLISMEGDWKWNSQDGSIQFTVKKLGAAKAPQGVTLIGTMDDQGRLHMQGGPRNSEMVLAKE